MLERKEDAEKAKSDDDVIVDRMVLFVANYISVHETKNNSSVICPHGSIATGLPDEKTGRQKHNVTAIIPVTSPVRTNSCLVLLCDS